MPAMPIEEQVLAQKRARYEQLGELIDRARRELAEVNASIVTLQGERETIADKLAEAADTDEELVRWCYTTPGAERLTAALSDLHPSIVGFMPWKNRGDDDVVRLMPDVDLAWSMEIDEYIDKLADGLVAFARRFGDIPVTLDEAHKGRILWARQEAMPPGRMPVYLRPAYKDEPRWGIEFDPETRVAMLIDGDDRARPYAGTLSQALVKASRVMNGEDQAR